MSKELISKATRNEFREVLVGFVLRDIEMIFDAANLKPRIDFQPSVSGQRRSLVEQYYEGLDFSLTADVRKILFAYEEVIQQLVVGKSHVPDPQRTQQIIDSLLRRMNRDGFVFDNERFVFAELTIPAVEISSLIALTEESIAEQIEKARTKIEEADYAGAIASAYTLLDGFLKELLRGSDIPISADEGDIRVLYNAVAGRLNLNPAGENLESYLRGILQGLKSQIGGFYELANKASDRHVRRYNPAKHHARLAVNATFTLCEFLLGSFEYQHRTKDRPC